MTKETHIKEKKEKIRREILGLLRGQDASLRDERSGTIIRKLLSSGEFAGSKTVLTYVSLPTEVDTWTFIKEAMKQAKRVAVPYIEPETKKITASELTTLESLEKGPLGIYQPKASLVRAIPLKEIDLVVIPAIAYDRKNMRLGRGKGYYDKFLAEDDLSLARTIGLAFHFQVVESLPFDLHDRPVSRIITD